jgi:hypothetical protein
MTDILDDLRDLQKQATTERSHYYVAACCARAIGEVTHLRQRVARLEQDRQDERFARSGGH